MDQLDYFNYSSMRELPTYSFGEVAKKTKEDKQSAREVNIALSDQNAYHLEIRTIGKVDAQQVTMESR